MARIRAVSALTILVLTLVAATCGKAGRQPAGIARDAVITGFDSRACPCCGGLMINFKNESRPYMDSFYLIDNSAAELGITPATPFPVYARVEYRSMEKCNGTYIRITHFQKR